MKSSSPVIESVHLDYSRSAQRKKKEKEKERERAREREREREREKLGIIHFGIEA